METCSICLDEITDKQLPITLSCNHKFHFSCFKKYVFKKKHCFYIDCHNCRQLNNQLDYPFKDDYKKNIIAVCQSNMEKANSTCKKLRS